MVGASMVSRTAAFPVDSRGGIVSMDRGRRWQRRAAGTAGQLGAACRLLVRSHGALSQPADGCLHRKRAIPEKTP